jgi:hypothetical protein
VGLALIKTKKRAKAPRLRPTLWGKGCGRAAEQIRANPPAGDAVTIDSIEVGEVVGHA